MRTVRTLASSAERARIWARFPTKTLILTLTFGIAAILVFALVDRVVPASPGGKPLTEKAGGVAKAPEKPRQELLKGDGPPFSMGSLIAVAAVLAGAVGTMFLLKRVLKGSRHVPSDKKLLRVRDVLAMGPKRAIYLIGLEDRNLVVGLSGDQLTLLSEYSAETEEAPVAEVGPTQERRAAEPALARRAPADELPNVAAEILDAEPRDVEPTAAPPAPAAQKSVPGPRVFSFAAVPEKGGRVQKPQVERVPHKFRQLLEKAAEAEGHRS